MARASAKKRTTLQGADEFDSASQLNDPAPGSNVRKKAKTLPSDGQARRSSRANRGSGGQIAQLQNIERIQTQTIAKVTPMDVATANEPINPLAPLSEKRPPKEKSRPSKGRTGEKAPPSETPAYSFPVSVPVLGNVPSPGPTRQLSNSGSRYGFHVPSPAAGSTTSRDSLSVPPSSRGASTVPPSMPTAPTSHRGSAHPPSRGCSATPVSRGGSVALMSRGVSAAPVSRGGPAIPAPRGGAYTPSAVAVPTSPIPLRASQIARPGRSDNSQARVLSRTFSVHDINALAQARQFSAPAPPPYDYRANEDGDTEPPSDDCDDITLQRTDFQSYHDPGIDEVSPDEDERMSEAVLHARGSPQDSRCTESQIDPVPPPNAEQRFSSRTPTPEPERYYQPRDEQGSQPPDTSPRRQAPSDSQIDPVLLAISQQPPGEDVVRAHHQRNGFPRAPAPQRLRAIDSQRSAGTSAYMPASNTTAQVSQPSSASTGPPTVAPTAANADGELTGSPTKLRSYPHKFREVIERAKLIAQCDSSTKDPFPPRSTFLDVSSVEIFNEAIHECENPPPGYWPNYRSQLGVLLWESLMTWRSIIKAKARDALSQFYDIGTHRTDVENQSRSQELIKGAAFLRNGVDAEGSTNNMAHPASAHLVMDFFYAPSSVGTAFPEVFSREVPRVALCLTATALRAALDEYTQAGLRQDRQFEYATYSKVFAGFLDMQNQIDRDPKHAMKTKKLRVAWASANRTISQAQPVIAFRDEFCVVLD